MTAFPDAASTSALERARVAYSVSTGSPLPERAEALRWALATYTTTPETPEQRAVPHVVAWLDDGELDGEVRVGLGLPATVEAVVATGPEWKWREGHGWCLFLSAFDADADAWYVVALDDEGWTAWGAPNAFDSMESGDETGTAGMDAAEAALRRAKVLAEGVTVRRPVSP